MKRLGGFTLIEMIIVILLIAILSTVAVPKFIDLTESALQAAEKATIASIQRAIAIAYGTQGNTESSGPPRSRFGPVN